MFENLEMSYPAGRKVFGALFFKRSADVIARVEEVAAEIGLADQLHDEAGCSPMARSSGWKSACC